MTVKLSVEQHGEFGIPDVGRPRVTWGDFSPKIPSISISPRMLRSATVGGDL